MSTNQRIPAGAAREFARNIFAGPIIEQDEILNTDTQFGLVLAGNGDRVGLLFVNLAASDQFIALTANVTATQGIRIGANGGLASFNVLEDYTLPSRAWYAASNNGAQQLYCLEILRVSYGKDGAL